MEQQESEKDKTKKKWLIGFVAVSDAVFGVIGCLLIAAGVLIMTNYLWNDEVQDTLLFIPNLTTLANITGSNGWTKEEIANISVDMSTIAREPAVIMLCLGSALVLLTMLGFVNCCDEDTTLALVVNVIIISILVLTEIVLSTLFWTGQFAPAIKAKLNDTLTDEYFGAEGKYDISVTWNFFMLEFECCGLDGYEDFIFASRWVRNYTEIDDGRQAIITLDTPLACCKFHGDFPYDADYIDAKKCMSLSTVRSNNSNFDEGCWASVHNFLKDNNYITIGFSTTVALLILQGLLWIGIIICSVLRIYTMYQQNQANKINAEPQKSHSMDPTENLQNGNHKNGKQLIHVKPEDRLNSFIFGEI